MAIKVKANTTEAQTYMGWGSIQHAIARAPNGRIWIAYVDENGSTGALLAAYSDDGGVTWTEETVVAAPARCYAQYGGLNLLVNSSGAPIIVYYYLPAVGSNEIRYVDRAGGSWGSPETIKTLTGTAPFARAVIDGSNNIHVGWTDFDGIYYLVGTTGSWGASEKAVDDASATNLDMTVNNSSQPVIVYIDGTGVQVQYRTTSWQPQDTVDIPASIYSWIVPVIAIDRNGDYHVAWQGEEPVSGDYEIYYRKKEGGAWLARQTIATESPASDNWTQTLGLDKSNDAYVVYQHGQNATDETAYVRKITGGDSLSAEAVLDSDILQPGGNPSVLTYLWHKYPSSGVLASTFQPIVVLLNETASLNADLYFEAAQAVQISAIKGNPNVDQLMYQHVERMRRY